MTKHVGASLLILLLVAVAVVVVLVQDPPGRPSYVTRSPNEVTRLDGCPQFVDPPFPDEVDRLKRMGIPERCIPRYPRK
jgi:hypothetical protein